MVVQNNIGQAIKQRRKELGIDQRTLAMLAQVSVNTVVAIERETSDPALSTINKICNVLGLEVYVDLKGETNIHPYFNT